VAAVVLLLSTSQAVEAHHPQNGFKYGDGYLADGLLSTCYEDGTPVYTNRGVLNAAIAPWGPAFENGLRDESLGRCGSANVRVWWGPIGSSCTSTAYAITTHPNLSNSISDITFNSYCPWYFGNALPVPNGWIDARTIMIHELGHALGLSHWDVSGIQVMQTGGPCGWGLRVNRMTWNDIHGAQERYPNIRTYDNPYNSGTTCVD
jgi:hypothetical protein